MYIKVFDCETENDLEIMVNEYLENIPTNDIIDIKYCVATLYDGREQIYCFSCLLMIR